MQMFVDVEPLDTVFEQTAILMQLMEISNLKDAYSKAKAAALQNTLRRVNRYRKEGIRNDLVHLVFLKRLELIGKAKLIGDLRQIDHEPKPCFDGVRFYTTEWSIPEEEMIIWSLTSLLAPLKYQAVERYQQLIRDAFGFDPTGPGELPEDNSQKLREAIADLEDRLSRQER